MFLNEVYQPEELEHHNRKKKRTSLRPYKMSFYNNWSLPGKKLLLELHTRASFAFQTSLDLTEQYENLGHFQQENYIIIESTSKNKVDNIQCLFNLQKLQPRHQSKIDKVMFHNSGRPALKLWNKGNCHIEHFRTNSLLHDFIKWAELQHKHSII